MGPRLEIGLNCSYVAATKKGNGSVAISDQTGAVLHTFPTVWGGDEMYYEAGAAHYVFSGSNNVPPTLAFAAASPLTPWIRRLQLQRASIRWPPTMFTGRSTFRS